MKSDSQSSTGMKNVRQALEAIARTTFSGSEMDEAYMRGNRDAHATCASMVRGVIDMLGAAQGSPDREKIAQIIDPNFPFWEFAVPNSFQQKRKNRALAKADAILALRTAPQPASNAYTAKLPIAAALARRLCQMFDSGGESQRSARARHASAIFQILNSAAPEYLAEQRWCDASPISYLEQGEALAASSIPSTPRCTCAAIVNPTIPHARTCPMSPTNRKTD